jgi:cytochrome oxidase Cu insertion factor (SCO1/SenC/PrrC family)
VRELENTGIMVSGVIAIVSLFIAGGLLIYTSAYGTPGTWKSDNKNADYGGAASITAYASGRWDTTGYKFDWRNHQGSRGWSWPITAKEMIVSIAYYNCITNIPVSYDITIDNPNQGGYGEAEPGSFGYVKTKVKATFHRPIGDFTLETKWAQVYP